MKNAIQFIAIAGSTTIMNSVVKATIGESNPGIVTPRIKIATDRKILPDNNRT